MLIYIGNIDHFHRRVYTILGAIKLNVAQLLEKYKQAMKTSTVAPSSTTTVSTTKTSRRRGTIKKRSRRSPLSDKSGTYFPIAMFVELF